MIRTSGNIWKANSIVDLSWRATASSSLSVNDNTNRIPIDVCAFIGINAMTEDSEDSNHISAVQICM
jgi:hypothetical protein